MDGIQQTFTLTGTKGMSARITVTETYDIAANTSAITVAVELACSAYFGQTYYLSGSVAAAERNLQTMDSFRGTHYVTCSRLDTYYPIAGGEGHVGSPWQLSEIIHNTDGTAAITVSVDITGQEPNGRGADGFTVSGSKTVTLTHIPRASTVAATDANIGAVSMIAIGRKSAAYTHSIQYRFGSLSGYITENGGISTQEVRFDTASVAFRLPTEFYAQIPNSASGTVMLTCRTYHGSTQIGDATGCSFAARTEESICRPMVFGTVRDINDATVALTGNDSVMVRYMSTALCTISAAARNGASLTAKAIAGSPVSEDTRTLDGIDVSGVRFSAQDSRGYITEAVESFALIPYVKLTCNPTGQRTNPTDGTATLSMKGSFFNGSFGAAANALTVRYRQGGGSWVTVDPVVKDNAYTATVSLTGLTYTQSFIFTVEVSDKLAVVTKTVRIDKGIPVFDWGETDFRFHVPVVLSAPTEGSHAVPLHCDQLRSIVGIPAGRSVKLCFTGNGSAFITCQGWHNACHAAYFYSGYGPGGQGRTFLLPLFNSGTSLVVELSPESEDGTNGITVTNQTSTYCTCCVLNMIASPMQVI